MQAHGNGNPETCASNLLRTIRGEVPYDRVRGRDGIGANLSKKSW